MNPKRKQIIISEIKYWKQNKLLPAHYCDFLITLYARGEEDSEQEVKATEGILVKEKKRVNRVLILLAAVALLVSGSMFIAVQYPTVTIGLTGAIIMLFLLFTLRKSVAETAVMPFIYILTAFMLLAMSLKIWFVFFEGQTMLLIGLLIVNCTLWLFAGRLLKLLYFTISGAAGLLLIIGFLFISF